jgi:hypothetical protein
MTRYVVRFGADSESISSARSFKHETDAEAFAFNVGGMELVDALVGYSQVVRITDSGEELLNEFEY